MIVVNSNKDTAEDRELLPHCAAFLLTARGTVEEHLWAVPEDGTVQNFSNIRLYLGCRSIEVEKHARVAMNLLRGILPLGGKSQTFNMKPIGFIKSCFKERNGTPRQGLLCPSSRAELEITSSHSKRKSTTSSSSAKDLLDGIGDFSHVYLLGVFDQNKAELGRSKVEPPHRNQRVGVLATRSPTRPNPVSLSIAKLERVEKNVLYLRGVDLIDGTPILDVKPYLPHYDAIPDARAAAWTFTQSHPIAAITWRTEAEETLRKLVPKLQLFRNYDEIHLTIEEVLRTDPRPPRKLKNGTTWKGYGFMIDKLNVLCDFDEKSNVLIREIEYWPNGKKANVN